MLQRVVVGIVAIFLGNMAQAFPDRPIQIIVPYSAGGIADLMARTIADRLSQELKTVVTVVNKGGANGVVGARSVARARPDGYTILFTPNTPLSINPLTQKNLPYDPENDLEILSIVADSPIVIVTRKNLGVKNLKEMATRAATNNGGLNYSAVSIAGVLTLPMYKIQNELGFDMTPIPYQGAADAMNAVIAGDVDVGINALGSALPFITSGKVIPIAVGTEARIKEIPGVETIEEAVPGFKSSIWYSLSVPSGMDSDRKQILADAFDRVKLSKELQAMYAANYLLVPAKKSPMEMRDFLKRDIERWKKVIVDNNINVQQP
ncbi:hypothetical protein W822_04805 [Advenella kashmirensis W13003]|uniref:ABC transporter substrate-binding protein n=1 Tax=Advenella kashmirensis W13003 TaxID=1424334 RepID=V8QYL7_9BURK|nr:tripartite tricarboxylate transporter substrate binding protein [Advenella kashmirensis]ETF04742.1 hypothetical protein W822_04805 [Advenella kashmirensis W13003]